MEELTEQQVEKLRGKLTARCAELKSQLEQAEESSQPVALDQQAVGRVSRIDAIQQQEMAVAGRAQASQLLRQVVAALARIESGDYGYCTQCDELINAARLQAQPHAPYCLGCQSKSEL